MTTTKTLYLAIVFAFFSAISMGNAHALPLWQYGIEDQSASEFRTVEGGSFETESVIDFGNVSVNSPSQMNGSGGPGYLYGQNPYSDFGIESAAAEMLTFEFTLEIDYRRLDLFYGRMGSEVDQIFFDGAEIFKADGTAENHYDLFEYAITGEILAGTHSLTIAYLGDYSGNGHFIDFVRMENGDPLGNGSPAPVPEPGTIILVGSGLVGLLRYRKKFNRS